MNSIFRQPGARWALFLFAAAILVQFAVPRASAGHGGVREADAARARLLARGPDSLQTAFRDVAKVVGASVVSVANVPPQLMRTEGASFERAMRSSSRLVVGSGVVVSADGYVVTNAHVARAAPAPAVILPDRRVLRARVVGIDDRADLAVLDIEAEDLTPIVFAEPDAIEVGDWVIAAGSPFGLSHTITAGIVSAVGRGDMGIADYEEFIQTDAAINPGNSGGPLVNLRGELVGINTAIASRSGSSAGIGFSIPVPMVRFAMKSLIDSGRVDRGVIGVGVVDVDATTARERGLAEESGVLVVETTPAGPAARAGIRAGDVILRFAGEAVEDSNRFRNRVAMTEPGAEVPVILIRDGRREKISLTIGQRGA